MDHVEINEAIGRNDVSEVERAYRVLVGFPGRGDLQAPTGAHLMHLLDRVTTFLAHDTSIMPPDTCAAANMEAGATYAEARVDFVEHREWWHARLVARVGKGK